MAANFIYRPYSQYLTLVEHTHAVGDEIGALHFMSDDYDRHLKGSLQQQDKVVNSGRDLNMRHIGRAQRIDIGWLHGRVGVHPQNDFAILFYGATGNTLADIYAKAFAALPIGNMRYF